MIYGICAIAFNVVMSYDCMPYMSQVLVDRTPYGTPCRGTAHQFIFVYFLISDIFSVCQYSHIVSKRNMSEIRK